MADAFTRWPAPAKLNLMLHIVGRRSDGYHLLQTVFQLLDWGDWIDLRPRPDGQIRRLSDSIGVPAEQDLAVRAATLLQQASGCRLGVDLRVDKQIPQGGGFGGGSSNAGTVLVALNALWGCALDEETLADLGLRLGADVPLFVRGRSAFAEGVGERLTPLALPERWFVLIDAGVHLSTAELFQAPELTRNARQIRMEDFAFDKVGSNAFTAPARARSPRLAALLDALAERGAGGLTGSGGGCFAMFDTRQQAEALARDFAGFGRCSVARGVEHSPLHRRLRRWQRDALGVAAANGG